MALSASLLTGIDRLDPFPVSARKLTEAVRDERTSVSAIAEIVELDQAIAASVLRMARSAGHAGSMPVRSIHEAVLRLGTTNVLNCALGDFMRRMRVPAPMYNLTETDLWVHAGAASLAVRAIGAERPGLMLPPMAETAALLHDIGKLILVRYLRADMATIVACCDARGLTFVEAERELFGCDHAEVGGMMARRWGLSDDIVQAIERHHDVPVTDSTPVLDAVIVGNTIAKMIGAGLGAEELNLKFDPACQARLGLNFLAFSRVVAQSSMWLKDLRRTNGLVA